MRYCRTFISNHSSHQQSPKPEHHSNKVHQDHKQSTRTKTPLSKWFVTSFQNQATSNRTNPPHPQTEQRLNSHLPPHAPPPPSRPLRRLHTPAHITLHLKQHLVIHLRGINILPRPANPAPNNNHNNNDNHSSRPKRRPNNNNPHSDIWQQRVNNNNNPVIPAHRRRLRRAAVPAA